MCGITGIYNFTGLIEQDFLECKKAINKLEHRGPDYQTTLEVGNLCLGHSRLSIIDTSEAANQPFQDESKRFTLSFNGEIYNYKELRKKLRDQYHVNFTSGGDTEVLLYWLIKKGMYGIGQLNGFFAFALHDKEDGSLLLVRDRYGIKPLTFYHDSSKFIFASELMALQEFSFKKELDQESLSMYLQLSYVPEPYSMLKNVKKLEPGHVMKIDSRGKIEKARYYELCYPASTGSYLGIDYSSAQKKIVELLSASVEKRLVADVPLGTFLSGGVDSSIITAIASQQRKNLSTFSIGYKDEPYFDETNYALSVAKKFNTDHHVFQLSNKDIEESILDLLDDAGEPFADSSAIAVNVLAKKTREQVTVALSGDGADELFSGYHKHMAEHLIRSKASIASNLHFMKYFLPLLPQSRNSKIGNLGRKAKKFIESSQLSAKDRYWFMASLLSENSANQLLLHKGSSEEYAHRKVMLLSALENDDFNDVLYTDFKTVLLSDMLHKVDKMSMKNSLEVRVPFLDHHLVDFVFQLPADFKIEGKMKKRILQDAFRDMLPAEIYRRPKKGFEVPLLKLLKGNLNYLIDKNMLSDEFILEQNIFDLDAVKQLKNQLKSTQPSNSQQNIWSLLLFNTWWINNF